MWPFAKALLLTSRYLRRIAVALEDLRRLYEMDLRARNVYFAPETPVKDTVDICYGPQSTDNDEW